MRSVFGRGTVPIFDFFADKGVEFILIIFKIFGVIISVFFRVMMEDGHEVIRRVAKFRAFETEGLKVLQARMGAPLVNHFSFSEQN